MHITNLTRGFDRTYTFALTTSWSAGGHAEWILERPASVSNNNTHPYLAATFDTTFTGARTKWGTSSYTAIGSLTHTNWRMMNCTFSTVLETAGALSSDGQSFTLHWRNYGDNYVC
jgi:hypothetical protein